MNLRALDLNLLVVFDAIARESSVTRAAERISLSQPAVSNALSRLRAQLGDELFVKGPGGRLRPTALAVELAPRLSVILSELRQVLEGGEFDPATAESSVTIAAVDYFSVVVLPHLMRLLEREAPGIRVRVTPAVDNPLDDLGRGDIDFAAVGFVEVFPERFGHACLIEDGYSCLLRKDHPFVGAKPTLERYLQASHVLVSPRGHGRGVVDDELAKDGLFRNVTLVISHFSAAPEIVARTDMVLSAPTLVVKRLKTDAHIMHACPVAVAIGARSLDLVWHERLGQHPSRVWIRDAISRAAIEAVAIG